MKKRLLSIGVIVTLAGWSCEDSVSERLAAARLAERCAINSDCADPYVCVFERCHEQCEEDRDCLAGQRCVRGTEAFNVCQLPDEIACTSAGTCPGDQVCAIDDACRDACSSDDGCVGPEQVCVEGGVCASIAPGKDELDPRGQLIPSDRTGDVAAATGATTGPDPGDDTASSSETNGTPTPGNPASSTSSSTDAGEATSGGSEDGPGPEGTDGGGTGGTSGSGGEGETGTAADPLVEPEDGSELVENDLPADAQPLSPEGTEIVLYPAGDDDWFYIDSLDEPGASIVTLRIEQDPGVDSSVQVRAAVDQSSLGVGVGFGLGVDGSVFFSAASGARTLLGFSEGISPTLGRVRLSYTITPELDPQEPNDALAEAAPIEPNTVVSGQLVVPYRSAGDDTVDDWFEIDLDAGAATFELLHHPEGSGITGVIYDAYAEVVANFAYSGIAVGPRELDLDAAGTYYVVLRGQSSDPRPFVGTTMPRYMAEAYEFRVTQ